MLPRIFIFFLFILCVVAYDPRLIDYFLHSRFVLVSGALLLISFSVVLRDPSKRFEIGKIDVAIALFCLWNLISIQWSHNFSEAIFAAQKWILFATVFWICRILCGDLLSKEVFYIARVSRLFTVLILLVVSGRLVLLYSEGTYSNEALYGLQNMFGHRSLISAFIMLLLPINLMDVRRSQRLLTSTNGIILWQIIVIVLLQSRAVYLALFLGCVALCFYLFFTTRPGSTKTNYFRIGVVLTTVAFLIGAVLYTNPELRERLNPLTYATSQTAYERRLIWLKTTALVKDHPWQGVGTGNWKIQFPGYGLEGSYRMQDQNVVFTRVHNDFLEILAELGVIGLLLYLSIFTLASLAIWQHRRVNPWPSFLLALGLGAFVIFSCIDFPKERIEFLVLLALYLAFIQRAEVHRYKPVFQISSRLFCAVLALCMMFNLMSGISRWYGEIESKKMLSMRAAKDWSGVIRHIQQAQSKWYELDPSTMPLPFYSGIAHYHLQQHDEAERAFTRALQLHPYNFQVINNLATVLIQKERYMEAIEHLKEALRINDRFEDALFNLAYCYYALGQYNAALDAVGQVPDESEKKLAFIRQIQQAAHK